MTPQYGSTHNRLVSNELSQDDFAALLTFSSADPNDAGCSNECTSEIAALRQSLALFREATCAHADNELRGQPRMTLSARRLVPSALQPAWLLAAAAFLLTALLPIQLQRRHTFQSMPVATSAPAAAATQESDEALLQDIDSESSVSLPPSMQVLADPSVALNSNPDSSPQQRTD